MTELSLVPQTQFIAPVTDLQTAKLAYQGMKDFVSSVLRKSVDFGEVPGTDKPTLLKPGAEKLSRFFGLSIRLEEMVRTEDWTGADHDGEPFFFYRYKALAMRGDYIIAEGIGSCSTWEKKYRYRQGDRKCPKCGQPTIFKSKNKPEFYCWTKKGGCGATFRDNDKSITEQEVGQVINPNPADLVNTVDKMAQKRAIVAVVLLACNASEYFTQDVEDYIDSSFVPEPEPTPRNASRPVAQVQHTQTTPPEPEGDDAPSQQETPAPAMMTLETAQNVVNSEGMRYGDLPREKLANMIIGIDKALKKNGLTYEQRNEYQFKLAAIKTILAVPEQ